MYHPFRTMPSVNDELAALRAKGSVRTHSQNLSSKSPRNLTLSTPEAEAAAIKAKREQDKVKKNEAKEGLRKTKVSLEDSSVKHGLSVKGKKAEERERVKMAKDILSKGASGRGGGASVSASGAVKAKEAPAVKAAVVAPPATRTNAAPTEIKNKPAPIETALLEETTNDAAPVETATTTVPDVATINDNDNDDDDVVDDVPELEEPNEEITTQQPPQSNATTTTTTTATTTTTDDDEQDNDPGLKQITNRNEKKSRKMMQRLGMRAVPGVARVTLKTGGGRGFFVIDRPDVFCQNGTYVIFGEARQGGGGGGGAAAVQAQHQAAMAQQQAAMAAAAGAMESVPEGNNDAVDATTVEGEQGGAGGDNDNNVDASGVESKDIELVMSQASCSRAKAVGALKENDGDLVNAIMSLTT